jgi:hypothetical protein
MATHQLFLEDFTLLGFGKLWPCVFRLYTVLIIRLCGLRINALLRVFGTPFGVSNQAGLAILERCRFLVVVIIA